MPPPNASVPAETCTVPAVVVALTRETVFAPVFVRVAPLRSSVVAPKPAASRAQLPEPPMEALAVNLMLVVWAVPFPMAAPELVSAPVPPTPVPAMEYPYVAS